MNLTIDVGNTLMKVALFENYEEKNFYSLEKRDLVFFEKLFSVNKIEHGILCSVREQDDELINFLRSKISLLEMNSQVKLPIKILYENQEALGADRLALACGASFQYPQKNVLVIGCGTCITIDFVNEKQEYIGGSISPGVEMRLKAMNHFTAKLPLLEISSSKNFIGRNTEQAMLSGAVNGAAAELDGMISLYKKYFSNLEVILTGGNTDLLLPKLESKIFADSKFLLHSLNKILLLNAL